MTLADPPRTLVVADGEDSARAAAALLNGDLAAGVRVCVRSDHAIAQARAGRAEVIVLALPSLALIEQIAPALREAGRDGAPTLIALCDAANTAAAARLCRQGVIYDYVQHFPAPVDEHRLATSVRLAVHGRTVAREAAEPTAAAAPAAAAGAERRRPVVVVVEDDEALHELVAAMLAPDVDLVFESDGGAAFDRIQAIAPDLVLMDIMLPGRDGVAITEQLKSSPALAAIPVVMLTGEARFDTLVRSMQAGAADFIVKPFTRDALVAKLGKFLPAVA
ncbi:MAG TPA: response regulator [Caldimonas sp.]|jgi:CheY-like chemotaxis protein|nr:response regulator [Caldimonas sp.]HEX4235442.1 response regulator [Caldimonas sp.]